MLKKNISGAYSVMDCLGLAIGVRDECDDFIASLSLSKDGIDNLATLS